MLRRIVVAGVVLFVVGVGGCSSDDASESNDGDGGPSSGDDGGTPDGGVDAGPGGDAASDASTDAAVGACSDGSPLVARFDTCNASPPAAPSTVTSALATATRGGVISLGSAASAPATDCFPVRVCIPTTAPTMLFSDSPESPTAKGVLYADTVPAGHYRIYVYHTNGANDGVPRKFPIVVLNQGAADAHATIVRKGIGDVSKDYVSVGKIAAARWLSSVAEAPVTVPAGKRIVLDAQLDEQAATYQQLVNAIYDVDFDATVKVSVVALQPGDDAATVTATLSLLSADTDHQRGTFPGAEREVEAEAPLPAVGVTHLSFGGNTVDADLAGIDATTGKATSLVGNYGVVYKFLGTASGKSAFVMAPRGGGWGGAGNVSAGDDADAGLVQLPATTGSTPADGSAIVLGRFASGATVSASFLSAGGSSLPVSLVNVPLP